MAAKTLIPTTSTASGGAIHRLQGSKFPTIRFLATTGTYSYAIRVAVTPDEPADATAHQMISATGKTGSDLAVVASSGAPINAHALFITYAITSGGGTMTVYVNDGEDGP